MNELSSCAISFQFKSLQKVYSFVTGAIKHNFPSYPRCHLLKVDFERRQLQIPARVSGWKNAAKDLEHFRLWKISP